MAYIKIIIPSSIVKKVPNNHSKEKERTKRINNIYSSYYLDSLRHLMELFLCKISLSFQMTVSELLLCPLSYYCFCIKCIKFFRIYYLCILERQSLTSKFSFVF